MSRRPDLTALVGSRICHDLISPLGAIGNGVELLGLSGVSQTPEMALIEESVQNAHARIRFFRVAYGSASEDQTLSRSEVTATLLAAARGGRISYLWDVPGDQPRPDVRIAFLILQCLEAALPMGGEIKVSRTGTTWLIHAETNRLRIEEPLWDSLVNPRARVNFTAAQVQFALLPDVLAEHGRKLRIEIGQNEIKVQF